MNVRPVKVTDVNGRLLPFKVTKNHGPMRMSLCVVEIPPIAKRTSTTIYFVNDAAMSNAEIAVCVFEASFARCHSPVPLAPDKIVASSDIFVEEPATAPDSTSLAAYAWPTVEKWDAAEVPYLGTQYTRGVATPLEVQAGLSAAPLTPLIIMQVVGLTFCTCCILRACCVRGEEVHVAAIANDVRVKKTDKMRQGKYGLVGNIAPEDQDGDNPFDA
jgi:hypothetical protein